MKLILENWQNYLEEENNPQTKTLMGELEMLLKSWPACDDDPGSLACKYHKDLEEVVKEFGGTGCPAGTHEDEKIEEICPGATSTKSSIRMAIIDET